VTAARESVRVVAPVRCQGKVKGADGRQRTCLKSARYVHNETGDVRNLLVYDPLNRVEIGWCCAEKNRARREDFLVNWIISPEGFDATYTEFPDTDDEEVQMEFLRKRFAHALSGGGPSAKGGQWGGLWKPIPWMATSPKSGPPEPIVKRVR